MNDLRFQGMSQGKKPFEDALLKPVSFYADHNIHTLFGVRATRIDPQNLVVELENGDRVPYRKVSLPQECVTAHYEFLELTWKEFTICVL